jgi:hypothetical protein
VLGKDGGGFGHRVRGGGGGGCPFSTPPVVGPPKAEENIVTYRTLNHPTSLFYNVKGPYVWYQYSLESSSLELKVGKALLSAILVEFLERMQKGNGQ